MRLTLIVITGLILIGATYAWTNSAPSGAQAEPAQVIRSKTITTVEQRKIKSISQVPETLEDNHATPLDVARIQAKATAGLKDPFGPLVEPKSDAKNDARVIEQKTVINNKANGLMVPPPPPGIANPFGDAPGSQLPSGLDMGELPMPPEDAAFHNKVELVGIVGDRAIFQIKSALIRRRKHWPKTFTLGTGESFDGMKLISVKDESAVVEEDGQTFTKPMPLIK